MTTSPETPAVDIGHDHPSGRRPILLGLTLVLLFYAAALPVIFTGAGGESRGATDQNDWHLRVIHQFMAQWPHLDLSDYPSSTTPVYHIVIAALGRATNVSTNGLRIFGSLFTALLLAILGIAVGRRMPFCAALAICLPVLCSIYVFSAGVFLLPDSAGWLGVLCVMLIALRDRVDRWTYVLGGLLLFATVLIRQIDLWLIVPLLTAVFTRPDTQNRGESLPLAGATASAVAFSPKKVLGAFLAILPSILLLLWLRHLWHGTLVPPNQRSLTSGFAPSAPAIVLSITGVVAAFFAGFLLPSLKHGSAMLCGAIGGAVVGILPVTTYNRAARRYSGIWNAVPHFPYWFHRSPLIIILSALGGAAVVAWLCALPRRQRWIWGAAGLAFVLAQFASANPWQRYYEPFIFTAAALTTPAIGRNRRIPSWAIAGPIALSILCTIVTLIALAGYGSR